MRNGQVRNDADRCLPILLRVHGVQDGFASRSGRLLCVLLFRFDEVPPDAARKPVLWLIRRRRVETADERYRGISKEYS